MANLRKKTINKWDDGILTSKRSNNPDTSYGAQMIKGFDIYKDKKRLIPMQSWEDFTTDAEKSYGIRAMGGTSDTVYLLGNALSNWYGRSWGYRIRVDVTSQYHLAGSLPLHVDMSLLGSDFWDNSREDKADVRVTNSSNTPFACFVENVDQDAETGSLWVDGGILTAGSPSFNTVIEETGTGSTSNVDNSTAYAFSFPVTLSGNPINYLVFKAYGEVSTGFTLGDIVVDLYTNNAGSPGTLVTSLGTIDGEKSLNISTTGIRDVELAFDTISYSGSYHLVFRYPTASGSSYLVMTYGNSGTTTIKQATDSGITTWSDVDTTATPYFKLRYFTNPSVPEKYFYIYYGNPDATEPEYGFSSFSYEGGGRDIFRNDQMRFAYTFGDEECGNRYYSVQGTGNTEAFSDDPQVFVDSIIGKGIETYSGNISTDPDDEVTLTGSDISVSLLVKTNAYEDVHLFKDELETFSVKMNSSGKILFTCAAAGGTTVNTTTDSISLNQWHIIDCVFDGDAYIYLDGVLQTFSISDGNFSGNVSNNGLKLNSGEHCSIAQVWGWDNDISANQVKTKFNNFSKEDFFSFGSEESFSSIVPSMSGVQVYYKLISSGNITELLEGGRPVKNLSYYPVNSFIDSTGTHFVISQEPENQGILTLAEVDTEDVLNPTYLTFSTLGDNNNKIVIQFATAVDGVDYLNRGNANLASISPADASVIEAQSTIESISPWKTYLAMGSNSRNKGFIDIWDLADSISAEKVTTGTGNVRIIGSAGEILFCVVDNFIDDIVKSSNKPSMEIWKYVGNGALERTHLVESQAIVSSYSDDWERAVSNFKIERNGQVLFYARIPNESTGTTFDEGFWAIGKNSDGELSLSLQISTEGLGMPENVFGFAQQVFFIEKDGGIVRLSDDTYDDVSLFTTLKMNEGNTQVEKKLHGVEIVTEPLESGQTISVYYRIQGQSERTKIFDMTGEDEITYETTFDDVGTNLPHYKEIEFDIESTGGKSSVLEFSYKYEYLSDII